MSSFDWTCLEIRGVCTCTSIFIVFKWKKCKQIFKRLYQDIFSISQDRLILSFEFCCKWEQRIEEVAGIEYEWCVLWRGRFLKFIYIYNWIYFSLYIWRQEWSKSCILREKKMPVQYDLERIVYRNWDISLK